MTYLIDRGDAYKVVCNYLAEIITESGVDKNEHTNRVLRSIIEDLGKLPCTPSEIYHQGYEAGYNEAMEDIAGEACYKQGYEDGFTDAKAGRTNEYEVRTNDDIRKNKV